MFSPHNEKASILIIDDDEAIRSLLIALLSDVYDCRGASSAEEALKELEGKSFDLVLSDIDMGGMSGLDLVPRVHFLSPDTVVLMISGHNEIETAIKAMRAGAFDYMAKPLDIRHVEAAVERALSHCHLLKDKRRYKEQLETLLQQRTAEVDRLAYYDTITHLPNRTLFEDRSGAGCRNRESRRSNSGRTCSSRSINSRKLMTRWVMILAIVFCANLQND